MGKHPRPTNILLHKQSRVLTVDFDDGSHFDLSCAVSYTHLTLPTKA